MRQISRPVVASALAMKGPAGIVPLGGGACPPEMKSSPGRRLLMYDVVSYSTALRHAKTWFGPSKLPVNAAQGNIPLRCASAISAPLIDG